MTKCKSRNPEKKGTTRCYLAKNHNGPHKDRQKGGWKGKGWTPPKPKKKKEPEPKVIARYATDYGPPRGR